MKALGIKDQPAEFPYLSQPWDISLMSAARLWRLGQKTNLPPPPRGSTCHHYYVIFIKLSWECTNFFSLCYQPKPLSLQIWCLVNKMNGYRKEFLYLISHLQKQYLYQLMYSCSIWAIMYFSSSDELLIEGLFVDSG